MLNAFLWSGVPDSARGAKVAWESVCTSKESGGLGLRRISGLNIAFGINHLWNIFAGSGSLWVAWVRRHYVPENLFWTADFTTVGNWTWRCTCETWLVPSSCVMLFLAETLLSGMIIGLMMDQYAQQGDRLALWSRAFPSMHLYLPFYQMADGIFLQGACTQYFVTFVRCFLLECRMLILLMKTNLCGEIL